MNRRPLEMWRNYAHPSSKLLIVRLHTAVQHGDRDDVQQILNYRVPVRCKTETHGNTTIHLATMNVHYSLEVITLLIENGADVNTPNRYGKTPLHLVLERDNCDPRIIKLMLDAGADVNRTNVSNSSALHFAVQNAKCKVEVMNMLLEYGAELNSVNCVGDTPLLRALRNPNCTKEIVQWLLGHGANIEALNHFGRSALHSVVENRKFNLGILKLLLKRKVPLNALNSAGKSPLFRAVENRCDPGIVQTLLDAGALLDNGESVFEKAIEICESSWTELTISNLSTLIRYAILRSLDFDVNRFILTSKYFRPLWHFKNLCKRDVLKMNSEEIMQGITVQDYLARRKQVSFNASTADDELCNLDRLLHFLALDMFPVYRSTIVSKLEINDIYDNLRMYSKNSNTEPRIVWMDHDSMAYVTRYLSSEDVLNSALAFHSAEVCDICAG